MKYAVLVAGGTGGHINAAIAVGDSLSELGFEVLYLTGQRSLDFKLFKGLNVIHLNARPLRTKNPLVLVKNIVDNLISFFKVFKFFIQKRPRFVIGAGGYVCGPTLLAGFLQFIPVFIIEQNAVMGLTNRVLGWISTSIFVHFTQTRGLPKALVKKVKVVGNPTRKSIVPVNPKKLEKPLKVLVFGGSLGAAQINQVIFDMLKNPPVKDLSIHHQLGGGQKYYEGATTVQYSPMEYIEDMQAEYDWCDVIISRSGASTISELALIKKPVLIFPYPKATDNHQWYNAQIFKDESDFTVEVLDPKMSHESNLRATEEFLVKASQEALKYSLKPHAGNETCREILKEIRKHVGLA
jgi:UDP-N-acetylglucosamine--N-acetylmuramyl-(pentapeptide) pyrophosphoryl-undecaprenol N-acetylglucosamine transferase